MSEKDVIVETAKAVQETAGLGSKIVDAGRAAGGWLDKIFGQAIADTVAINWTDRVRARRIESAIYDWERLTLLFHKTSARLKHNAKMRPLPPKIGIALLEGATVEFDDDLHSLWANLLASAMTDGEYEVEKRHITILSELSATDAVALGDFHARWVRSDKKGWKDGKIIYGPGFDALDYGDTVARNLFRLGLIAPSPVKFQTYEPGGYDHQLDFEYSESRQDVEIPGDMQICMMTETGMAFCKAVGLDEVRTSSEV